MNQEDIRRMIEEYMASFNDTIIMNIVHAKRTEVMRPPLLEKEEDYYKWLADRHQ